MHVIASQVKLHHLKFFGVCQEDLTEVSTRSACCVGFIPMHQHCLCLEVNCNQCRTSHACTYRDDVGFCQHRIYLFNMVYAVLQNIELLESMATDQHEQYSNLQAQLAELQESQSGLDQEVHEATQVHAVLAFSWLRAALWLAFLFTEAVVSSQPHTSRPFIHGFGSFVTCSWGLAIMHCCVGGMPPCAPHVLSCLQTRKSSLFTCMWRLLLCHVLCRAVGRQVYHLQNMHWNA